MKGSVSIPPTQSPYLSFSGTFDSVIFDLDYDAHFPPFVTKNLALLKENCESNLLNASDFTNITPFSNKVHLFIIVKY